MERYRILDHAGDGKIRAFGATLEEAFGNAALAVVSLMTDRETIERRVERGVAVEGGDLGQLLVRFLNEILYLFDAQGFLPGAVENLTIEAPAASSMVRLTARLAGDDRPGRYEFHGDVKAVTYNEMKIETCPCGPGPWTVQVVVDL
ncbi:MAG: archease [Acidobacteriota bacterium]|nr:archease [Acidobacteriota bacterium]